MILNLLLLLIGIFILFKGADFLVDGASRFAYRLGLSPLFVGLTIVFCFHKYIYVQKASNW